MMSGRRNLRKERRRFGFWRWYLPRLIEGSAILGFAVGCAIAIVAFIQFVVVPAIALLIGIPLHLQISAWVVIGLVIVTLLAWGSHWAEVHGKGGD